MISFSLSDEQQSAQTAMRDFAAQVLREAARDCDENSAIPDALLEQTWELGLVATQLPEEFGGYGASRSPITNAIVLEELAHGDAALAVAATAASGFAFAVADQGTAEQKAALLPAFGGERLAFAAVAANEPSPAFDVTRLATTARRDGADFVLDGRKVCVPFADRASHFLVLANSGERHDAFIVPRDAAGLTIAAPEKNLGLKSLTTGGLDFDGVRVAASQRLGGDGGADVGRIVNQGRVALAAILTGLARAVLDYCVPYAKERVAFDEPIARKQSIAFRLAEMHMEIECSRWLTWKAASQLEQSIDATKSAHLARRYTTEKAMWVADNGVQVLGGHGFIRDNPVEMWYRNARTLGVLEALSAV